MHGIVMVWFFLIPSIPTTLGNFFVPLMIGAHDLAFPRINLASWYVFNLSGLVLLYALIMGGIDTGWTFYTPFSTLFANGYVIRRDVGGLHQRVFVDHDGAEFRRDDPSAARAGHDLDAAAAVRLGDLRGQRRHAARDPGAGDDLLPGRDRTRSAGSAFSIRRAAATRCCSSTCSGSTRIPRSTS